MIWATLPSLKTLIYLILSNWPARFVLSCECEHAQSLFASAVTQPLISGCNLQALQDLRLKVTRVPEHWCPPAGPSVSLLTCAGGLVQREPRRQSITEMKNHCGTLCFTPYVSARCSPADYAHGCPVPWNVKGNQQKCFPRKSVEPVMLKGPVGKICPDLGFLCFFCSGWAKVIIWLNHLVTKAVNDFIAH